MFASAGGGGLLPDNERCSVRWCSCISACAYFSLGLPMSGDRFRASLDQGGLRPRGKAAIELPIDFLEGFTIDCWFRCEQRWAGQKLYRRVFLYSSDYFFNISEWYIWHSLHEKPFPILRLSVFQQLIIFDLLAMTGSASGGAKTAHIRLESGGKGRWVAEEEIINGTVRLKNEYWEGFLCSARCKRAGWGEVIEKKWIKGFFKGK